MLGLGWTEMLLVGVVALIVIGPKDLPMVMNRIGKFAGMIRRMGNEFQREISKTAGLDEVRNLRDSLTAPLKETTDEIRREFNAMGAGGAVKPSGVIKPADPQAESVVSEIRTAAGLAPAGAAASTASTDPVRATPLMTPITSPDVDPLAGVAAAGGGHETTGAAPTLKRAPVRAKRVKVFTADATVPVAGEFSAEAIPTAKAASKPRRPRPNTALSDPSTAVTAGSVPKRAPRRKPAAVLPSEQPPIGDARAAPGDLEKPEP